MKIGARVFKTSFTIVISLMLSHLLIPGSTGQLAGIAAVIATQSTLQATFDTFIGRIISNTVGAIMAVVMVYYLGTSPLAVGVTSFLLITLLNFFKLGPVIELAIVTVVVIMTSTNTNYVDAATVRVLETIIGVVCSLVVNAFILPPRYDDKFYSLAENLTTESLIYLRASLRQNTQHQVMHRDVQKARQELSQAQKYYRIMRSDLRFNFWKRPAKQRELVVYRQLLATTRTVVELLETFYRNELDYRNLPEPLRLQIRERLEVLMSAHEQILLKFQGKVPTHEVNFMQMEQDKRLNYYELFFKEIREDLEEDHASHDNVMLHMMSAILHYEDELEHLNKIVSQYRTYLHHKNSQAS